MHARLVAAAAAIVAGALPHPVDAWSFTPGVGKSVVPGRGMAPVPLDVSHNGCRRGAQCRRSSGSHLKRRAGNATEASTSSSSTPASSEPTEASVPSSAGPSTSSTTSSSVKARQTAPANTSSWIYPITDIVQSPIVLGFPPFCGSLSTAVPVNTNAGIDVQDIETIVSFGDSWSSTGWDDGRAGEQPIVRPPDAFAGRPDPYFGGRMSNGLVWVEWMTKIFPKHPNLRDFAVTGAVSNISLYPGDVDWNGKPASDFKKQLDIYAKQTVADPATTLYTVYFGINDYIQNPAKYPVAAEAVLAALTRLQEAPFNAKNILILGVQYPEATVYRQKVFDALAGFREKYGTNFAWSDMLNLVSSVAMAPNVFNYVSVDNCVSDWRKAIPGQMCADPNRTFYWARGHPSTTTALLIAQYSYQILLECSKS